MCLRIWRVIDMTGVIVSEQLRQFNEIHQSLGFAEHLHMGFYWRSWPYASPAALILDPHPSLIAAQPPNLSSDWTTTSWSLFPEHALPFAEVICRPTHCMAFISPAPISLSQRVWLDSGYLINPGGSISPSLPLSLCHTVNLLNTEEQQQKASLFTVFFSNGQQWSVLVKAGSLLVFRWCRAGSRD